MPVNVKGRKEIILVDNLLQVQILVHILEKGLSVYLVPTS